MIGFAEVAALITVVGAAIYGLGLLSVAWPIYKRWHNDAATSIPGTGGSSGSPPDSPYPPSSSQAVWRPARWRSGRISPISRWM